MEKNNKEFRILSLDGGGIKGLFTAVFLSKVEEDLKINIIDYFDLIVGTSTGSIIALALCLGIKPKEVVNFYIKEGKQIFNKNLLLEHLIHAFSCKYDYKRLEKALKNKEFFKELQLGNSIKRLVIPSYSIDSGKVYLFKTSHAERLTRDYKIEAWKIVRAACAAPTYFRHSDDIDKVNLIDGGIWANNPAMVGFFEAVGVLKKQVSDVNILSIGTLQDITCFDQFTGFLSWINPFKKMPLIKHIMQAQSEGVDSQLSLLLKDKYYRISPKVEPEFFDLDKLNLDRIYAKASECSRYHSDEIKRKFINTKAEEFIPFHKLGGAI